RGVEDKVARAVDRSVKVSVPPLSVRQDGTFRGQAWVDWRLPGGSPGIALRAWLTPDGLTLGDHPGWYRANWYAESRNEATSRIPAGMQEFRVRSGTAFRLEPGDPGDGEWLIGRALSPQAALERPELAGDVEGTAVALQAVVDALARLGGENPPT